MYPNLKLQIWKAGIHQNELARELNVDETVLSRIINGYRQPSAQLKARTAQYFHVDESWLFERAMQFPIVRFRSNPRVRQEQ
jgi:transcriptional regulator with XRE-family HTH domain